jgi:hypothetical protein
VDERYFTPAEVETLIPTLTEVMGRAVEAHRAATALAARLREEQQRIAMVGGGVVDQDGWRADKARLADLARRVQESLDRIVALGGVPKDLGLGLVDFLHLRDGRRVNLCWKHGEDTITHWHGLDEGYAARKPL